MAYNYKKMRWIHNQSGSTLVELIVTLVVASLIALGFLGLYTALVAGTIGAKRQSIGLTLAVNQLEYLRGLAYDSLAVSGGSILASNYLPSSVIKTVGNASYKVTTSISYVDDAYDGCTNYPSQALKSLYCRGYSAATPTAVDTNPADYKIATVVVTDKNGSQVFAQQSTQLAARVAETASTTGAMFVTVVDSSGGPVSGAQVQITNSTVSPTVALGDQTDSNGVAIFYNLPLDSNLDYVLSASKAGYSSLNTIAPSGSLQPVFANLTVLSQQSSSETLVIKQMNTQSLLAKVTDTNGTPISNAKLYLKGGYKRYTAAKDTSYYFDNLRGGDTRPTTDSNGMASFTNLVPGSYYFCGDIGATSCSVGGSTYYLAAAVPFVGSTSLNPVTVPVYDPGSPPVETFSFNGLSYLQQAHLILTTNANFPRVMTLTPSVANASAGNINSFPFTLTGANLPCTSTPGSCGTTVKLSQGGTTITASCTSGVAAGTSISCTANLSSFNTSSIIQLTVQTSAGTLNLPGGSELGGIVLEP